MGAPARTASAWQGYRLFYSQFRQHFHTTGAIAPSGAALARAITAPLALAPAGGLRVLEVGAGTGVFTRAILGHLGPGDALDVYEINPAFRPFLQARLAEAEVEQRGIACRLHFASVAELAASAEFDFIVSGLPLNNFAPAQVEELLALFLSHLRPGGVLSYFEYLYIRDLKCALIQDAAERTRLRAVGAVVAEFLRQNPHQQIRVPWNLPPAVAHHVSRASPPRPPHPSRGGRAALPAGEIGAKGREIPKGGPPPGDEFGAAPARRSASLGPRAPKPA